MKIEPFAVEDKILRNCYLNAFKYQLDTYLGCAHYCKYCYIFNSPETNYNRKILIFPGIEKQLSLELSKMEPQIIYMGMNSDPYQPAEERYHQTGKVLQIFTQYGFPVSILTKSPLILRDVDILKKMPGSSVGVSLAVLEEKIRRLFEKSVSANQERINVLKKCKEAGIRTSLLICPVIPFLTDIKALVELALPYTDSIWVERLRLDSYKSLNWHLTKRIIGENFPEILKDFEKAVFFREHPYWQEQRSFLKKLQARGISININL